MKLVFNASMPRSGSELLQVLLHQNPRIYGSATSPLLEYQFAARANYGLPEVLSQNPALMQTAFLKMCGGMAESYYSAITDRPVVVDKNRGWSHYFEWVEQWNPNPKMVCMVRDLRSVLASMERIYRETRHLPAGPDNPAQLQGMTVEQRVRGWLNSQPVGLALQRTLDLFQRGVAGKILFVRYEDLCGQPQATLDRVYEFFGECSFAHDFSRIEKQVQENDLHFGPYGRHSVAPEIRPVKSGAWKEIIPGPIAQGVQREFGWFFDAFGY